MQTTFTLLINCISTWYMVGLIWMVQVVHYPLFSKVGETGFASYEQSHSLRITPVVGVPMLLELITAMVLCFAAPQAVPRWMMWAGLILLGLIWISTAMLQVPCHQKLSQGFDLEAYRYLVVSNWIRTVLWTARGGLMGYALWLVLQSAAPSLDRN